MSGILANLLDDVSNLGSRSLQESRYLRQQKQLTAMGRQSAAGLKKTFDDEEAASPLGVDAARKMTTGLPSMGQQLGLKTLSEAFGAAPGQSIVQRAMGLQDGQTVGQSVMGLDAGQSIGAKLAGGQGGQSIAGSLAGARPGQSVGQTLAGAPDGVSMGRALLNMGPGRTMIAANIPGPSPAGQPQVRQDWTMIQDTPNASVGQPLGPIGPSANILRAMQTARAAVAAGVPPPTLATVPSLGGPFDESFARMLAAKAMFQPAEVPATFSRF